MPQIITFDPPQPCMYLDECGQPASTAVIWPFEGYGLKRPRRYVMMPVCPGHLSAAAVMYPPDAPGPKEGVTLTPAVSEFVTPRDETKTSLPYTLSFVTNKAA